jgi:hypothetical protein
MWKHPDMVRERITIASLGIDWEGFRALVESDGNLPQREDILGLLDGGLDKGSVLRKLSTLDKRTVAYMKKHIYPKLQYSSVRFWLNDNSFTPVAITDTLHIAAADTLHAAFADTLRAAFADTFPGDDIFPAQLKDKKKKRPFAVGTNLLYDMALLPNFTLESAINDRWSVVLQGAWSWWQTKEPNYWSHRIQMLWLESRYRFGDGNNSPFSGLYTGIYGAVGNYDIRLFPKGPDPLGVLSRFSYSLGLTAGYSIPLARHWNMEFNLGMGYMGGAYKEYNHSRCEDCYPERGSKERRYLGPTQAAVSLIRLINCKNERK